MQLLYLDPRVLEPDPDGVRESPGDVSGLARTIAEQGLLQPLGVIERAAGTYQVVYGNRRRQAAIELGLERVPCILLDPNDPNLLLRQLTENVQRQELNDMEQARAFARLRARLAQQRGITGEQDLDEAVGREVGLSGRTVRRYLGLLDLPDEIQQMIRRGDLTVTQAQHLRRITNKRTQIELAQEAAAEGMSAAELSRLAAYFVANPNHTIETALQAILQGDVPRDRAVPEISIAGDGLMGKTSVASVDVGESDADIWGDDNEGGDDDPLHDPLFDETLENQPANKAKVFRIRSLDQMVQETDRLSRALAEGDVQKWLQKDENPSFKVRLLLRQLDVLSRSLREIATREGWE